MKDLVQSRASKTSGAETNLYPNEPAQEQSIAVIKEEVIHPPKDEPIQEHVVAPLSKIPDDEALYDDALKALRLLDTKGHENVHVQLVKLIDHVESLKRGKKEKTTQLTKALVETYELLTDTNGMDSQKYNLTASTMQGSPSTGLSLLGGLMLALGIAVAILGVIFFPVIIGAVASAAVGAATTGALVATTLGVTSGSSLVASIGIFAVNSKRGLSRNMCELDRTLNEYPDESYRAAVPTATP